MNRSYARISAALLALLLFGACAHQQGQKIKPTAIRQATAEIPEDELLDIGIMVFDTEALVARESSAKDGTPAAVRKAESHYIPYHLKTTLQRSGYWGSVWVAPSANTSVDLMIRGELVDSNGETLALKIKARDAAGRTWLDKSYSAEAMPSAYTRNQPALKDPFQDTYNTIVNDLIEVLLQREVNELKQLRMVAQLKYAGDLAPDAFEGYLIEDKEAERLSINRLPADDDTMMRRIMTVREREYMYVDTLNRYYEQFYSQMWPSYVNWRKLNLTEIQALRKIKRDALLRQLAGALLIAGAIALDVGDVPNTGALQLGMVLYGGHVIVSGFNVSEAAQIHSDAIRELAESFGSEMEPVVMDFQDQQYDLSGTAEEQFERWRQLLRRIYAAETGFMEDPPEN
jgi:hypothetical protein